MEAAGLRKIERPMASRQGSHIVMPDGRELLNLCANNYLGLAGDQQVVDASAEALHKWGYGMASVRFICGTQSIHQELESQLAEFLGMGDAILYSSCFDANTGLFETLLSAEDAIISDELNHASVIDGIRLCKARRFRYKNNDLVDLENQLRAASDARFRLIATDGVFSMDGLIADLPGLCALAERYEAMIMVDDSHAVGFMGARGRGTHEHHAVMGRVDIITGTLGKALGGASGGYTAGPRRIIDLLRQRSRPYLFSNSLAPSLAATSLAILRRLASADDLRRKLWENTRYFRGALGELGFNIVPGEHPIIPILFGEPLPAKRMAERLHDKGVFVVPFSYPVVPMGKARIRVQVSAAHSREDMEFAARKFAEARTECADA